MTEIKTISIKGFAPFMELKADSNMPQENDTWEYKDYDSRVELSFEVPYSKGKTFLDVMREVDPEFCEIVIQLIPRKKKIIIETKDE